jgi:hypothetical protein
MQDLFQPQQLVPTVLIIFHIGPYIIDCSRDQSIISKKFWRCFLEFKPEITPKDASQIQNKQPDFGKEINIYTKKDIYIYIYYEFIPWLIPFFWTYFAPLKIK